MAVVAKDLVPRAAESHENLMSIEDEQMRLTASESGGVGEHVAVLNL